MNLSSEKMFKIATCILVIAAILLLSTVMSEVLVRVKSESLCGDPDGVSQFRNIIYDVTKPYQQMMKRQPDYFHSHNLESTGTQVCSQAYYRFEYEGHQGEPPRDILGPTTTQLSTECHVCPTAPTGRFDTPFHIRERFCPIVFNESRGPLPEIGIIFRSVNVSQLNSFFLSQSIDDTVYYPEAIFLNKLDVGQTCTSVCHEYQLMACSDRRAPSPPGNIKFRRGVELNERQLDCLLQSCFYNIKWFSAIVLNIRLSPITTILSYQTFVKRLTKVRDEKLALVWGMNPRCEIYFRISLSFEYQMKAFSNADLYMAYFAKYADTWVKKQITAKVLLDTFPVNCAVEADFEARMNTIYPYITTGVYQKQSDFGSSCQLPRIMEMASPYFEKVLLDVYRGDNRSIVTKCKTLSPLVSNNKSSIMVRVTSESEAVNLLNRVVHDSTDINFKTIFVEPDWENVTNFHELWRLANSRNILVGCLQSYSHFYITTNNSYGMHYPNDYFKNCAMLTDKSQIYLVEWSANHLVTYHEHLTFILEKSLELRKDFLQKYPNGTIYVRLYLSRDMSLAHSNFRLNLYCQQYLTELQELQQAVVTWSQIHNFVVIVKSLFGDSNNSGWWFNIITEGDLNRTVTDFPLIVHRNVPETTSGNNSSPYAYPCVHWTEHILKSSCDIKGLSRIYSGTSVNLDLASVYQMTTHDCQNLLSIAFERFAHVEISGNDSIQLSRITDVLESNLFEALIPRGIENGNIHLYIELSDNQLFQVDLNMISESAFRPFGVHIRGWENHLDDTATKINVALVQHFKSSKRSPINVGLTIKDCSQEINSQLVHLKALPYFGLVNYVVCITKPIAPTNSDKVRMQMYLDTHFYIQRYLRSKLGIEAFFRLTFNPKMFANNRAEIENYFRFLNDTNQYAEGYGVKYFMGDAFSTVESNQWSWWLVSANGSANLSYKFTELESAFFGRPTQQRYKVLPLRNLRKYVRLIIVLASFLLISVAGTVGLWIYNRRMRRMFLTKAEVNAFRNGEIIETSEESIGLQYVQVNTIKTLGFNPKFEIRKKYIQLATVIGHGNFGMVYNGTINGNVEVAVKVPNADCSKDSFKRAYTKEIDRGLIYVITEYCKNGSLEIYLRKMKPKSTPIVPPETKNGYVEAAAQPDSGFQQVVVDDAEVDIHELITFSYEIATGMEYIASKKVVHADLSTRNVLLDAKMKCKIGDFGLSRKLYESKEYIKKGEEALPWRWMSVESLTKMEFTSQSDVWSFGVTLWEIFSLGEVPYPGISWSPEFSENLADGLRMCKPHYSSDEIYSKIVECWNDSPESRPTFSDLIAYFEDLVASQ